MYDFANLLFAGPCNARCPFCIGRQLDPRLNVNNLDEYLPRNLDQFMDLIREHDIRQVIFTGTTTDPQLYRHEARLLEHMRRALPPGVQFALHTNGLLALQKMDVVNLYDKICLSIPSLNPATYLQMTGVRRMPDLASIIRRAVVPVKVSCVLDEHNAAEMPGFLEGCHAAGVRRVVLRQLYGDAREWNVTAGLAQRGQYRGNRVYDYKGMEVTHWNFDQSESTAINLFSNGLISTAYLLTRATE